MGSALVRSMGEILFMCGNNERAVIATLSIPGDDIQHSEEVSMDEVGSLSVLLIQVMYATCLQQMELKL